MHKIHLGGIIKILMVSESWVGCPLVIHRRKDQCLQLLMDLSYEWFMINKTMSPKEPIDPCKEKFFG